MSLCQYKNVFGQPNKGIHSIRMFDLAVVDILLTIFASYFISNYFKFNFYTTLIYLFVSGIGLHRLFCVNTTINNLLFAPN